ncbi:hypothetical protein D1AOALGA4SA_6628 [Olavius algarvensis Delta 1 endosymbiont]|nr:hypothetical protein D1AOALGA4SA_6628 [Olavius algarvensis Delta 1 endosymbiont]
MNVEHRTFNIERPIRNRFSQSFFTIEWTHKRKNSHYISMIR